MYFLTSRLSQILTRFSVMLEIVHSVIKRDVGTLHKLIDFRPCFEPKHPPDLRATKHTGTVAFDREGLEGMPRQITPLLFEVVLDILRKLNLHCHVSSPGPRHLAGLPPSISLA